MERQASPFCPLEKFVSNGNNYDVNGMRNSSSSYSLSCRVCCWGGTVGHRVITTNDDVITWMASSTREFLHFVSANVQIIKRGWPHCAINESPFSPLHYTAPNNFLVGSQRLKLVPPLKIFGPSIHPRPINCPERRWRPAVDLLTVAQKANTRIYLIQSVIYVPYNNTDPITVITHLPTLKKLFQHFLQRKYLGHAKVRRQVNQLKFSFSRNGEKKSSPRCRFCLNSDETVEHFIEQDRKKFQHNSLKINKSWPLWKSFVHFIISSRLLSYSCVSQMS